MKTNHNYFSNLAFNLAENHLGKTKTNPSVGCVIVKKDAVISSGFTSLNGRPHAEFNALNRDINFRGSSMYVTLEPCTHKGVTPPCTKIIKKKRISKVFYCYEDPDKRTYKKAKLELMANNIYSKKIFLKKNNFYKSYFLNKIKNLPLLDAKIAFSKDNFTINKQKKWITNSRSRKVGHLLRSRYDCIISTSKSINQDNSLLNCRIQGLNNNKPDLIIIDRNLILKKNLKLLKISNKRKTYIFTSKKDKKKIAYFKKRKVKIIYINKLNEKSDFFNLLKRIFKLGKRRILVETGLSFLNKLLNYNLINDLYIFRSGMKLKNKGHNNSKIKFIKNYKLYNQIKVNLGEDSLFKIGIK